MCLNETEYVFSISIHNSSLFESHQVPYPRPAASVELRCGVLYSGCQCVKRDGLQQDCPRSECQGRPACLAYPAPTCVPSGNAPSPNPRAGRGGSTNYVHQQPPYLQYKHKLDKYLRMGREGYVDNPPLDVAHKVPCHVHRH